VLCAHAGMESTFVVDVVFIYRPELKSKSLNKGPYWIKYVKLVYHSYESLERNLNSAPGVVLPK
jgi:hypothetical protein